MVAHLRTSARAWTRRRRSDTGHRGDAGAAAVEYGLLVAAIAAVIILVVFALGRLVADQFDDTCQRLAGQSVSSSTQDCTDRADTG